MARCPHCEYPIPDDRERVGARCPHCRDPLYEPAGRCSRPAREGEASCAVHPGMEGVGYCARCNGCLCETCRTRWQALIVCAACFDRALAGQQVADLSTAATRAAAARTENFRQATAGVLLAGAAWLLAGFALLALRL